MALWGQVVRPPEPKRARHDACVKFVLLTSESSIVGCARVVGFEDYTDLSFTEKHFHQYVPKSSKHRRNKQMILGDPRWCPPLALKLSEVCRLAQPVVLQGDMAPGHRAPSHAVTTVRKQVRTLPVGAVCFYIALPPDPPWASDRWNFPLRRTIACCLDTSLPEHVPDINQPQPQPALDDRIPAGNDERYSFPFAFRCSKLSLLLKSTTSIEEVPL